ncbi:hypothetical protein C7974DRAFT_378167 [Boeremia exigua]|uniref:uncharacterized protein n=1 Tax=Boeremia exigua TaxID=749465 RepID=UPI001E8CF0AB|nr:uncharacterized protein C7974DRAFT_378167 [Boeremia exigua]KAH6620039.1 hypothetical protein C7974DRAFT_378167 [Boeremia exigua]
MDGGTAKAFLTTSAASERTGGGSGGNGRLKVTKWSGTCQGILFVERRSGWSEQEGGFCGRIGPKKFSAASNPRNSVLDRSGGEDDKEEVKGSPYLPHAAPSVSRTVTVLGCRARGHGHSVATSCCARRSLRCNMQQSQGAVRRLAIAQIRDACRGLTTRPSVAPSPRRLSTLAGRRAEMTALVDWLSCLRTPAESGLGSFAGQPEAMPANACSDQGQALNAGQCVFGCTQETCCAAWSSSQDLQLAALP